MGAPTSESDRCRCAPAHSSATQNRTRRERHVSASVVLGDRRPPSCSRGCGEERKREGRGGKKEPRTRYVLLADAHDDEAAVTVAEHLGHRGRGREEVRAGREHQARRAVRGRRQALRPKSKGGETHAGIEMRREFFQRHAETPGIGFGRTVPGQLCTNVGKGRTCCSWRHLPRL